MRYTENEVMSFIEDNDVKFIKLSFCDVYGNLKITTIQPNLLEMAFSTGIPIKAKFIDGFNFCTEELYLQPDLDTMCLLPWRPSHGSVVRFFCNIVKKDGTAFEGDTRAVLSRIYKYAVDNDIKAEISTELEFYLFKTDHDGNPTDIPFDYAGYMDESPEDKGEDVRRDICLTLEDMNISPVLSHHNAGPGQNEVDFVPGRPVKSADNVIAYRSVVKNMAARNGLYASFRPKPIPEECGSAFKIKFAPRYKGSPCPESFMAGMIARVKEITAILNREDESYERLGDFFAPDAITWGKKTARPLFIVDADEGTVQITSPDAAANPYLAYALLIAAGIEGVLAYRSLLDAKEDTLPATLGEARNLCKNSDFVKNILSSNLLNSIIGR